MKILVLTLGSHGDVQPYVGMRERAAALGSKIRAEDGIGRAIAAIEAYSGQQPIPSNDRIANATTVV